MDEKHTFPPPSLFPKELWIKKDLGSLFLGLISISVGEDLLYQCSGNQLCFWAPVVENTACGTSEVGDGTASE